MFTKEETQELYKIIKFYENKENVSWLTEDLDIETLSPFCWNSESFLNFLLTEDLISLDQKQKIDSLKEFVNFSDDVYRIVLNKNMKDFDILYILYLSKTVTTSFDSFFEIFRKKIIVLLNCLESEFEYYYETFETEDFEELAKNLNIKENYYSHKDIEQLEEYVELLKNLIEEDSLVKNVLEKMLKIIKK